MEVAPTIQERWRCVFRVMFIAATTATLRIEPLGLNTADWPRNTVGEN